MREEPFSDVRKTPDGLSIPELKWRELVFIGAVREQGGAWQRDPSRYCPPFEMPDVLPVGVGFLISDRGGGRVRLRRV